MSRATSAPFTPLPGMHGTAEYNSVETPVIRRLTNHFRDENAAPLLTIDEDDLLIESDALYFDAISRYSVPRDAMNMIRRGELTDEGIRAKQRAGRAIVRQEKADMYADRVMTSAEAADTCRSLYRIVTRGELTPVMVGDTVVTITHRVGDYSADMFRAGRETRLLKGPATQRAINTITDRFGVDSAVTIDLAVLAGANTTRKTLLWLNELAIVSKTYDRMTKDTKDKLMAYVVGRPAEYLQRPDLFQLIADKVNIE